jgi:hypothetical protein
VGWLLLGLGSVLVLGAFGLWGLPLEAIGFAGLGVVTAGVGLSLIGPGGAAPGGSDPARPINVGQDYWGN